PAVAFADDPAREQIDFFERKIRPVLVEHCAKCHSAESKKVRGGLLLDTREDMRRGGDTGPAVGPGEPDKRLGLKALRCGDLKMPPDGKLPDAVIADFEKWIKHGAADPRDADAPKPAAPRTIDVTAAKQFWSFRPPRRQSVPEVRNPKSEIRNPIDAFLVA